MTRHNSGRLPGRPKKQADRDELAADVEAFLEGGGTITKVPRGHTDQPLVIRGGIKPLVLNPEKYLDGPKPASNNGWNRNYKNAGTGVDSPDRGHKK